MDDTNQSDKNQKMVLKSIAKWLVIFALIAFVCYKNQDLMQEALEEIQITPVWKLVVCLLLGNLYFIAEGCIISEMTNTCDHRLSVWQGITCAYLCTFFRIATLGSGTGVAQLYYYNLHGIRVSTATGMSLAQYTFQKITIGLFGVVSFLLLILSGHSGIRKYAWYMFAGAVVISLICLFLFILTVSKKFSDLIMNEEIDAEMRKEFPPEIQKNTVLLTSLINSMLEVANLDVSEEKLPCQPTDLKNICVHEMEQLKKKEGIEYKLEITEESMIIPSNAQYLTQVIEHLLSNANKFTEKGQITLGYGVDKSKEKILIYVTDTGCGIPQEKHEEVFNRFSKLDTFVPGNGLGLYLCRLITKRLAGEIKIDPAYKEGIRMIVTLPIK